MKKTLITLFALIFGLTLVSCGENPNGDYIPENGGMNEGVNTETNNNVVTDTNRKVIYTVSYSINGDDVMDVKNQVNNKVIELEGYTSSSEETLKQAKVIYRIPTEKLNQFLDYIDSFDGVGSKQITSSDITSSYAYVEAKIQTLMASREAYVKILETENLSRSEIIQINDKIAEIDTELLKINNEKASYDNKLIYSTVTINYYVNEPVAKEPTYFAKYWSYLKDFFAGLANIILYTLPVILVAGTIFSAIFFPIIAKKRRKVK